MTQANAATDIDALKTRLRATWMDGNYDYFSRFMESSAVEFLDRLEFPPARWCWTWRADRDRSPLSPHVAAPR